jgi:phage internal scaffolding protein
VATYHKTGVLPQFRDNPGIYADVSDAPSYQDALQIVINAENQFMTLDAKTRKKFSNNPHEFLEFVENPENAAELVAMGLAIPRDATPSPAAPEPRGGQPRSPKAKAKPDSAPEGDES